MTLSGSDLVELLARIIVVVAVAAVAYLIGRYLWRTVRAVTLEDLAEPKDWEIAAPTGRDELVDAVDESLAELAMGRSATRSSPAGSVSRTAWPRPASGGTRGRRRPS